MSKRLRVVNGRVVDDTPDIKLVCTGCDEYREFDRESATVVRCGECGKRHSEASLVDRNTPGADP